MCKFIDICYLVKLHRCIDKESRNIEACWKYWENMEKERLEQARKDQEAEVESYR